MRFIPAIGDTLLDRYYVEEIFGASGETAILRCLDTRLDVQGVVKMLMGDPDDPFFPERRERFLASARVQARLNHPNIVHITNVESRPQMTFSVMEMLHGVTLGQHVSDLNVTLTSKEVIEIFISIIDAVSMAHAGDVLHRYMNPSNVILNQQGDRLSPRILNFAASRFSPDLDPVHALPYLAPEQLFDFDDATVQSDIFSICAMIYQVFTHRPPLQFDTYEEYVEFYHGGGEITYYPDAIPGNFVPLIQSGLRVDPAQRFASASQLLAELKRLGKRFTLSANLTVEAPKTYAPGTLRANTNASVEADVRWSAAGLPPVRKRTGSFQVPAEAVQLPEALTKHYRVEQAVFLSNNNNVSLVQSLDQEAGGTFVLKYIDHPSDPQREAFLEGARRSKLLAEHTPYIQDVLVIYPESCAIVTANTVRKSLAQCMANNVVLSDKVAAQTFILLGQALLAAHNAGFIHGNLKPSNVFFENRKGIFTPVLYDFGQRLYISEPEQLSPEHIPFAAPELRYNFQHANAQTDIFAFGMLLNYALLGRVPYTSFSAGSLLREVSAITAAPSLSTLKPGVYGDLIRIIDWCTAFEPSQRYANFSDILRDLYVVFDKIPSPQNAS
ncbi:MAG: protein kinase [Proteobacteria bacterium]|nr:protein kinase [Pseudomonadota bacterium]